MPRQTRVVRTKAVFTLIVLGLALLTALVALSRFCDIWFTMEINSDFATAVLLECHDESNDISLKLSDASDIKTLKAILKGLPFEDGPSCGFSSDVSITMTGWYKSIAFCPALDGCPVVRIDNSGKYIEISDEDRTKLDEVLGKYGITFPRI